MHPFRAFIHAYSPLGDETWMAVADVLKRQSYPKGTLLLEEGQICKKLYFLEEGLIRFFTWEDGEDISKFFTEAPYLFTSYNSFANGVPATDNIVCLEDVVCWEITVEDAFLLLDHPQWATFVRCLTQEVQFYTEELLNVTRNQSPESRYLNMLDKTPRLVQRIPLKYLASYLGIAPPSLSRIRKRMQKAVRT